MKCPCCNTNFCACFGLLWRNDWTLQTIHRRLEELAKLGNITDERYTIHACYWFLASRKPTRKQLKEIP